MRRREAVEVLAKSAPLHLGQCVAVGRGDDADVDRHLFRAAHSLELALLEDAHELRLQVFRQLADLVEEERAAVGLFENALPGGDRAGESASSAAVKGVIGPRKPLERRPSLSRVGAGYAT